MNGNAWFACNSSLQLEKNEKEERGKSEISEEGLSIQVGKTFQWSCCWVLTALGHQQALWLLPKHSLQESLLCHSRVPAGQQLWSLNGFLISFPTLFALAQISV